MTEFPAFSKQIFRVNSTSWISVPNISSVHVELFFFLTFQTEVVLFIAELGYSVLSMG